MQLAKITDFSTNNLHLIAKNQVILQKSKKG